MPRKQKQKQRQSQKQVVNINLGKSSGKPRRKYTRKPTQIIQQPNYTFTQQPYQLTPQVFIPPPSQNPLINQLSNVSTTNPLLSQTSIEPIRFESSVSNEKALKSELSQFDSINTNKPKRIISDREKYVEPSIVEPPQMPKRNIGPFVMDTQPKPKPSPIMLDFPKPREPKQSPQLDNLEMPFLESPSTEEYQIPSLDKQRNISSKRKPKKPESNIQDKPFEKPQIQKEIERTISPPYVTTDTDYILPLYATNQILNTPPQIGLNEALIEQKARLKPVNYDEIPNPSVFDELTTPVKQDVVSFKKRRGPYKKKQQTKL